MDESRKKGLLRLRHLSETTEAKAEDLEAQRPRFARLEGKEAAPRVVSAFNLFQTPPEIAERMAALFTSFGRILEPSAGLGRLYRAVRAVAPPSCPVVLVDISPECCGELYRQIEGDAAARLIAADFLTTDLARLGGERFDSILMNPPFCRGSDIRHVLHARSLLAPGGRLVSLVANGPRQRAALAPLVSSWTDLPAGTFDGTRVEAAIVVMDG